MPVSDHCLHYVGMAIEPYRLFGCMLHLLVVRRAAEMLPALPGQASQLHPG